MSTKSGRAVVLGVVLVTVLGMVGGPVGFVDQVAGQGSVVVDEDITTDTTWGAGTGPYRVVRSIAVGQDATLTIEPGVIVEFAEGVSLTVEGDIDVLGDGDEPVVLTSSRDDPGAGDWAGIRLAGRSSQLTHIKHATVEYATNGITLTSGQRVLLENVEIAHSKEAGVAGLPGSGFAPSGEVSIRDSSLHHNGFGIRGADERYDVRGTTIRDNGGPGIEVRHQLDIVDVRVRNTTITGNHIGINLESGVDRHNRGGEIAGVIVERSTIADNWGLGMRVVGDRLIDVRVAESDVRANGGTGIHLQDTGRAGGERPSGNVTVIDTRVSENGDRGLFLGAAYSTLADVTVERTSVEGNNGTGVTVLADVTVRDLRLTETDVWTNGGEGLVIEGAHVRTVAISDTEVFGNEDNGTRIAGTELTDIDVTGSHSSLNDGVGLLVAGSSEDVGTTVTGTIFAANENGLVIQNHTARVTENLVEYNNGTGLLFRGSASLENVVAENDVYGNGFGLQVPDGDESLVVDAEHNYWGASSGPHHDSINPEGEGDEITGTLDTVAFLTYAESAFGELNERPTPTLDGPSEPVAVGSEVTFRGTDSSDDGEITWYRFSDNGSVDTGWIQDSQFRTVYEENGTYEMQLVVVDDHGVPSATNESIIVDVGLESADAGNGGNDGGEGDGNEGSSGDSGDSGSDGESGAGETEEEVFIPGFGFGLAGLAVVVSSLILGLRRL